MKDELKKSRAWSKLWIGVILFSSFILHPSSFCFATPSQDDVLHSIGDAHDDTVDSGKVLAVVFGIAGLLIVVAVINHRREKVVIPKAMNHQGKLIKEIAKSVNLRPAEIKQLKILAESKELASPLVLLLCPSLLTQAVKENPGKIDRNTILSMAKKISAAK
jgi:hypothetical protein